MEDQEYDDDDDEDSSPYEISQFVKAWTQASVLFVSQNADTVWSRSAHEPYRLASKRAYIIHKRLRKMMNYSVPPACPLTVGEVIPASRLAIYGRDLRYEDYEMHLMPRARQGEPGPHDHHLQHHHLHRRQKRLSVRMPSWREVLRVIDGANRRDLWGDHTGREPWQHPVVDVLYRSLTNVEDGGGSTLLRQEPPNVTNSGDADDNETKASRGSGNSSKPDIAVAFKPTYCNWNQSEKIDGRMTDSCTNEHNAPFERPIRLSVQCERLLYISDSDVEREPTTRLRIKVKKICRRQTKKFLQRISSPEVRGLWYTDGEPESEPYPADNKRRFAARGMQVATPSGGSRFYSRTPRTPYYQRAYTTNHVHNAGSSRLQNTRSSSQQHAFRNDGGDAASWTPPSFGSGRSFSDDTLGSGGASASGQQAAADTSSRRARTAVVFRSSSVMGPQNRQRLQSHYHHHQRPPQQLVCPPREGAAGRDFCRVLSDGTLTSGSTTRNIVDAGNMKQSLSLEVAEEGSDYTSDPETLTNFKTIEEDTVRLIEELQRQLEDTIPLASWKLPTGRSPYRETTKRNFQPRYNIDRYSSNKLTMSTTKNDNTNNSPRKGGVTCRPTGGQCDSTTVRSPRPLLARSADHADHAGDPSAATVDRGNVHPPPGFKAPPPHLTRNHSSGNNYATCGNNCSDSTSASAWSYQRPPESQLETPAGDSPQGWLALGSCQPTVSRQKADRALSCGETSPVPSPNSLYRVLRQNSGAQLASGSDQQQTTTTRTNNFSVEGAANGANGMFSTLEPEPATPPPPPESANRLSSPQQQYDRATSLPAFSGTIFHYLPELLVEVAPSYATVTACKGTAVMLSQSTLANRQHQQLVQRAGHQSSASAPPAPAQTKLSYMKAYRPQFRNLRNLIPLIRGGGHHGNHHSINTAAPCAQGPLHQGSDRDQQVSGTPTAEGDSIATAGSMNARVERDGCRPAISVPGIHLQRTTRSDTLVGAYQSRGQTVPVPSASLDDVCGRTWTAGRSD